MISGLDGMLALAPEGRVHWLYHGTDLSRFGRVVRARAPEPLLLVVGRLSPPKGFDDALRSAAQRARFAAGPLDSVRPVFHQNAVDSVLG